MQVAEVFEVPTSGGLILTIVCDYSLYSCYPWFCYIKCHCRVRLGL